MTLVAAVSLTPLDVKVVLRTAGRWHNPIHLVVFFLTAMMLFVNAPTSSARTMRALILTLFCFILEVLEAVIYHNAIEWRDVLMDAMGVFCALALIAAATAIRRRSPRVLNG